MLATVGLLSLLVYVVYGRWRSQKHADDLVELDLPAGLGPEAVAELLETEGLVESAEAFAVFLRATGGTEGFLAGPHLLSPASSAWELRRLLSRSADRPTAKVIIPEGFNRFDVAARLHKLRVAGKNAFLSATTDANLLDELGIERGGAVGAESAEGYLHPATYDLPLDSDPHDLVRRLVTEADRRWTVLAAQHAAGVASLGAPPLGWGRRQVLTLASIIEKEAAVDDERPVIASVFLNRLLDPAFKPKRLQSDPTSAYGCLLMRDLPGCSDFNGRPTPASNQDSSNRYSTYTHEGLPPGPIANPGLRSIEAVLAPAATRFLYFVAAGGGRHTFSESLSGHNEAVRRRRDANQ